MSAAAGAKPAFPWDEVMTIGFGLLRLSPDTFWKLTPVEFERAMRAVRPARTAPPARAELSALMRAFPDLTTTETGCG